MMKRKRIAFFLLMVFILTQTCSAFAAASEPTETYVYSDATSDVYTEKSSSSIAAIVISRRNSFVEFTLRYLQPDKEHLLYHVMLGNDILGSIPGAYGSSEFWQNLKLFLVQNLDQARVLEISSLEDEGQITSRGSVTADLYEDLAIIHGAQYTGKLLSTEVRSGHTFKLNQLLQFYVNKDAKQTIVQEGLSLASVVVTLFSLANPKNAILSKTASLLGLTSFAADTIIPSTVKLDKYTAAAQYIKYVTVDNGNAPYSNAAKTYEYIAYNNPDLRDSSRAYLCKETEDIWYSQTLSYFTNNAQLIEDAYRAYTS